jgi:hypothetical protein
MKATPNLNGNTRDDFVDALSSASRKADALLAALNEVRSTCLHGRNYQTSPDSGAARNDDLHAVSLLLNRVQSVRVWLDNAGEQLDGE